MWVGTTYMVSPTSGRAYSFTMAIWKSGFSGRSHQRVSDCSFS